MSKDEQQQIEFIDFLKQLTKTWTISPVIQRKILEAILKRKGCELDVYITRFKHMINSIERGINHKPDVYIKDHPNDGKYIDSFLGASITTSNYTSNFSLRLFFSNGKKEIYDFQVYS